MKTLKPGNRLRVGEKTAEWLGDPSLAFEEVVIEGIGKDWVAVRDSFGLAHAVTDDGDCVDWALLQGSALLED